MMKSILVKRIRERKFFIKEKSHLLHIIILHLTFRFYFYIYFSTYLTYSSLPNLIQSSFNLCTKIDPNPKPKKKFSFFIASKLNSVHNFFEFHFCLSSLFCVNTAQKCSHSSSIIFFVFFASFCLWRSVAVFFGTFLGFRFVIRFRWFFTGISVTLKIHL